MVSTKINKKVDTNIKDTKTKQATAFKGHGSLITINCSHSMHVSYSIGLFQQLGPNNHIERFEQ